MEKLTNKEYWSDYWNYVSVNASNFIISDDHILKKWILNANLNFMPDSQCIEMGCFPGQLLTIFGEMGCILNGIDLVGEVETLAPQTLQHLGFTCGEFKKIDFFEYCKSTTRLFDVVSSFGFLEHFTNWEEVLLLHIKLLKRGGYLIMETPNFKSLPYYLIRLLLYKKSFQFHNLKSMHPAKWELLMRKNGLEVLYCGGVGNISEWSVVNPEMTKIQIFLRGQLRWITSKLAKILPSNDKIFSPYYGLIARKMLGITFFTLLVC